MKWITEAVICPWKGIGRKKLRTRMDCTNEVMARQGYKTVLRDASIIEQIAFKEACMVLRCLICDIFIPAIIREFETEFSFSFKCF